MKILYISSPAYADCDILLLKSLAEQGNDIMYFINTGDNVRSTLITLDEKHEKPGIYKWNEYTEFNFIAKYTGLDNIYTVLRKNRKSLIESINIYSQLQEIVDSFNPDIIHQVDLPYYNMLPFIIRNRRKYVLTVHDPIPHLGENHWKLDVLRRIIFPFIHKFIILNNRFKTDFCNLYSINASKVFISRLGFYDCMNAFVTEQQPENYILFYGRITPYKGIDYLLQAMVEVHKKFPDIRLIIAGSGHFSFDKSTYDNLDYITFLNRYIELTELANLIKNSKFVVCPYIEATQSGVVASVLALDTPIIVTNVGALPDMVEDFKNGLVIPPKDANAITNAICTMLSNKNLLEEMKNEIRNSKSLNGKYSWKQIAMTTTTIYKA